MNCEIFVPCSLFPVPSNKYLKTLGFKLDAVYIPANKFLCNLIMNDISTLNNSESKRASRFPQTVVTVSREEFIEPIELTIRDAQGREARLPNDLHGHYFMISPVGSVNSATVPGDKKVVWVSKDGWTALYNGDGMVYRLSFDQGHASLKTRLMKPPCYYADLATADRIKKEQYRGLEFDNLGISRASFGKLGIRNQLNTAFVPFKLADDAHERLLVTWDVGRPYEIDPETLETLTPVGKNQDWTELLPDQQSIPFKNLMTSAHPVFDPRTEEFFTVNVGKSLWTMFALSRSLKARLAESAIALESIIDNSNFSQNLQSIFIILYSVILWLINLSISLVAALVKVIEVFRGGYDFVHLLAWDGKQVGIKQKWNIVLPGYRPLRIDQTVHQMGITKDYIVFAESSFKFSLENALPYQKKSLATSFKIFLTDFLDYPQYPSTKLYIVKRADLKTAEFKAQKMDHINKINNWLASDRFKDLPKVVAQVAEIAPEFSHYLVEDENPNDQIVVYASHLAATDIAEYIRIFERSAYDDRDQTNTKNTYDDPELTARLHRLAGNIVSPMDIGRLGRWVIDGETGEIIDQQLFPDQKDKSDINQQLANHQLNPKNPIDPKYLLTWSTAFYIYQDQRPTPKLTDIFWNSWGGWPDTLTTRIIEAYENYPQRLIDFDKVVDLTYQGIPSSLCHLKIRPNVNNQTVIELDSDNYYQFDNHYLGTSAQFIPRPNAQNQTDGYIVCVVLTSDEFLSQSDAQNNDPEWSQNSEIWIFDALKLRQGPLYKLSHPRLNLGFSFHTTWLPEAKSPKRNLDYSIRDDYEDLLEQLITNQPQFRSKVHQLFEQEIYPQFEQLRRLG
jgi:carotenoid cleavage dioxygenase-like enzyme